MSVIGPQEASGEMVTVGCILNPVPKTKPPGVPDGGRIWDVTKRDTGFMTMVLV